MKRTCYFTNPIGNLMKSTIFLAGMFLFFHLTSFGRDFKKLGADEADQSKTKIARAFAAAFLMKLKAGETYQFKDEAIDVLKNQLTPDNQKLVYQQLKGQFGDFKSLEYAETWVQANNKSMQIVRLKGNFEKSNRSQEIRVVVNETNKISGFWVKPWSDMLY